MGDKKYLIFEVSVFMVLFSGLVFAQVIGGGGAAAPNPSNATSGGWNVNSPDVSDYGSVSGFVKPCINSLEIQIKKSNSTEVYSLGRVTADCSYRITNLEPGRYGLFVEFNSTQNFYNYRGGVIDIVANISLQGVNLTFTSRNNAYLIDRIMIKFKEGIGEEEKRNVIALYGGTLMNHYDYSDLYVLQIPDDKNVEEMLLIFKADSRIKSADPVGVSSLGVDNIFDEGEKSEQQVSLEEEDTGQIREKLFLLGGIVIISLLFIIFFLVINKKRDKKGVIGT